MVGGKKKKNEVSDACRTRQVSGFLKKLTHDRHRHVDDDGVNLTAVLGVLVKRFFPVGAQNMLVTERCEVLR